MRCLRLLLCLTTFAGFARGQERDRKLVDRLLRPNMSLTNSAQDKKFTAARGTVVERKFETKSFFSGNERPAESFPGIRDLFAKSFGTKKFSHGEETASAPTGAGLAYASSQAATKKSSLIPSAADEEGRTVRAWDYPGSGPFLGKGTRQKPLSQQDRPLTLEEVRELLNKNR
ncbi:MAG: hypothetical protein ACREIF_10610 [Chthoniobacterales bacterium]